MKNSEIIFKIKINVIEFITECLLIDFAAINDQYINMLQIMDDDLNGRASKIDGWIGIDDFCDENEWIVEFNVFDGNDIDKDDDINGDSDFGCDDNDFDDDSDNDDDEEYDDNENDDTDDNDNDDGDDDDGNDGEFEFDDVDFEDDDDNDDD